MKHTSSFFFGEDERLFGIHHHAQTTPRRHGVLICHPLFHEYYKAYFVTKRIAIDLAKAGFDVLRFDFTGTGDSKPASRAADCSTWIEDIGHALTKLSEVNGNEPITAFSARFSACLASKHREYLDRLVAWDPICDSERFFGDLASYNNSILDKHTNLRREDVGRIKSEDFLATGCPAAEIREGLATANADSQDCEIDVEVVSADHDAPKLASERLSTDLAADWPSPNLNMLYAHEVVSVVTRVIAQ